MLGKSCWANKNWDAAVHRENFPQCSIESGYFCFGQNRNSAFLADSANIFGLSAEIRHFAGKLFRSKQQFSPILAEIFRSCRNSVKHWFPLLLACQAIYLTFGWLDWMNHDALLFSWPSIIRDVSAKVTAYFPLSDVYVGFPLIRYFSFW